MQLIWTAELSLIHVNLNLKEKFATKWEEIMHVCFENTLLSHSGSANFNKDSVKLFHLTFTITFLQTALSDQ